MNKAIRFAVPVFCLIGIAGCGPRQPGSTDNGDKSAKGGSSVVVFAAASAINALDEIQVKFSKSTGTEVRTSCAASSTLAQQIVNGAEADLFLSADVKWADHVEAKLPVAKRRNLLGNRLVIVVPFDAEFKVDRPEDLAAKEVTHLALADPEAVPAGKYAKQALTKLGLWDKVKGKIASAEDVRHALTSVETGAAEAGIVYATDAAISKRVTIAVEIPASLTDPVRYPVLLLKRAEPNQAAGEFYDFLRSPEASTVFEKFGFVVLKDSGTLTK